MEVTEADVAAVGTDGPDENGEGLVERWMGRTAATAVGAFSSGSKWDGLEITGGDTSLAGAWPEEEGVEAGGDEVLDAG